jgi:lipopolysaccharide transport system permease protein
LITKNHISVREIRPSRGWTALKIGDLIRYRELLLLLTWRDIKVRYKQTVLGALWAIIQPVFTMVVFTLFFGRLAKIPSDGIAYPVFSFCALLPWQLFAYALTQSSNSLVSDASLVTKVNFPRLLIPMSSVFAGLIDFMIAFCVLLGLMSFYGISVTSRLIFIPPLVGMAVLTALSVGIWLSALNVKYRDVRYTIPFLTQLWLFASPVAYSSSLLPESWRWLYGLNPMVGVIEGFRWAMLGRDMAVGNMVGVSSLIVCVLFFSGIGYFRRVEGSFADII